MYTRLFDATLPYLLYFGMFSFLWGCGEICAITCRVDLSEEDVTLTLNAMLVVERVTTSAEGEKLGGVSVKDFLRQSERLESVSLSSNATIEVCLSTCTQLKNFSMTMHEYMFLLSSFEWYSVSARGGWSWQMFYKRFKRGWSWKGAGPHPHSWTARCWHKNLTLSHQR
jgi:hypothetical protein